MTKLDAGPRDEEELTIFAIEESRVRLQSAVLSLMIRQGLNRGQLAVRMKVPLGQMIEEFFSDDCNITIRELALMLHALDASLIVVPRPRSVELTIADARLALGIEQAAPEGE